ncbi:MAG: hypothetical protein HKL87_08710 [Acidimicrobiaceae bacterium]|nr:hypothetical protein [Acidimicrobiaceae bacterium]
MTDGAASSHQPLRVGYLTRPELRDALERAGVQLNDAARTLLESAAFDESRTESFCVVLRTVKDLHLSKEASYSAILAAGKARGLLPCPLATAPYLRLATLDQMNAPDSILSNGSAPSGSVTLASLRPTGDLPTGFYLRVIDGVPWLRGYHATDDHHWPPEDSLAFRVECTSARHLARRADSRETSRGLRVPR